MDNQSYDEFLKSKIKIAEVNPRLKPHNKLMVKWLVVGGIPDGNLRWPPRFY